MDEIADLLALQDGVIARRQALAAGMPSHAIAPLLRRRDWVPVHPGVYVNHTGQLTWRQRAWAAVLACWPAALDGMSAIRAHEGPGRRRQEGVIHVLVDRDRRFDPPEGIDVRRSSRFDEVVQWNLSPPRLRYDDAVIELADRASRELEAIAVLADACGSRRTTAIRLLRRIDDLPWLHRRKWLTGILGDVAEGTCSVLEHGYLTNVERPHGLPPGTRQDPTSGGRPMFRDVVYRSKRPAWTQIVELDGRLFHDSTAARDQDLERDLDAALESEHTVRLGYGQVFDRPCSTAVKVGRLLRHSGWQDNPVPCPNCAGAAKCGA